MSTVNPTPGSEQTRIAAAKPQRVLACMLCQQRKVKCDHKFPCQNCLRAGVQCVPTALTPRQRRRRLPERELLERLSRYEDLLRQNNIDFEPATVKASSSANATSARANDSSENAHPEERTKRLDEPSKQETTAKSEATYEAK